MPELPEVETVRRGLIPALQGVRLERVRVIRPDLRFPLPPDMGQRLTGKVVTAIGRRAKYLLFRIETGDVLIGHLGMSGRFRLLPADEASRTPLGKHDHVVFTADGGTEARFNDPRRFGFMLLTTEAKLARHPMIEKLGPEPLADEFNGAALAKALRGRKTTIKAALLDQAVVSGVGNIYACEALHMAGVSPRRQAYTVQGGRAGKLAAAVKEVLAAAIEAGGSSLRDHRQPGGDLGYFQHSWRVYGRAGEPCPGCECDAGVRRIVQSNRSTFYCPKRQR